MVPDAPYCGQPDHYGTTEITQQRGGRCEDCWHLHLANQRQVTFVKADDALKDRLDTTMALTATVPDHHGNPQNINIRWDTDETARPGQRSPSWQIESSFPYPDDDYDGIAEYAQRLDDAIHKARIRAGHILDHQQHRKREEREANQVIQEEQDPRKTAILAAQYLAHASKLQAQAEADYLNLQSS